MKWDAKTIALKINGMIEGLFYGIRDNGCQDDPDYALVKSVYEANQDINKLDYNNNIPAEEELRCSLNWWTVESQVIVYGDYHMEYKFYNLERESPTSDELSIQLASFTFAGMALSNFYESVKDVLYNGYGLGIKDKCLEEISITINTKRLLEEGYGSKK